MLEKKSSEILSSLQKQQSRKRIFIIVIVLILLIIIIFISFSVYTYFKSPEKTLGVGANIESVLLNEQGNLVYVKLLGGSLDKNITKIKFIFTDADGKEYYYETSEGIKEIEVPYSRSFWDWLFGRQLKGVYDYEINSEEIGLDDFNSIKEVGVLFEYVTSEGTALNTTILDTTRTTNQTTTGGGNGDGNGNPPVETCTNDTGCSSVGNFCDLSIPYNCSLGSDGCLDRVNGNDCGGGYYCSGGNCILGCSNECSAIGDNFCYGIIPYNCTLETSGCLKMVLSNSCGGGEICQNGKCVDETIPNTILYQDNFQDGNLQIDPLLENGFGWSIVSGNVTIENRITNKSVGLNRKNSTIVSEQTINYNEFTIETDVNIIWGQTTQILFLYMDKSNYYFFGITGADKGIYRVMNGVKTKIDDGVYGGFDTLPFSGNSMGRFKVYIKNDGLTIKFKVDKNGFSDGIDYEMEYEDKNPEAVAKFRNAKIGFKEISSTFNAGSWVYFDNVFVYEGLKRNTRIKPIETYYVSPSGDDSNQGTQSQPWKTIQKAADTMMAGDSVLIAPGIYEEGMIKPKYSGSKDYPITYKALDYNNKPILTGTVKINTSQWNRYNPDIYKTVLAWNPNALYFNDTQLFVAQEPNQNNPDVQMETKYFINVSSADNNDSTPEAHYQLVDSGFFTQPQDDFWNGATLLLRDSYLMAINSREIMDYIPQDHKIVLPYNRWVEIGKGDSFAIMNHLSVLDKPGEYYVDKGLLRVLSWNESSDKILNISVEKISGIGNATKIRIFLINESSGSETTIDTIMQTGQTKIFTINLTGKTQNLIKVYASVDSADAYELYVWPYNSDIENVELSRQTSAFYLAEYSAYYEYTIFDGLEVKNYQGNGLEFSTQTGSNRNNIVRNSNIHHNKASGVWCRFSCQGLIVENSKLHNNYVDGVAFAGGRNYIVQNNEIYGNLDNGIWSGEGSDKRDDSTILVEDIIIKNNYIYDQSSKRTHPDGIQLYRTSNATVDGNYLVQKGEQNTWFSWNGPIWFTNNIVINGTAGLNSATEIYIYNNIFYNSVARLDSHQDDNDYLYTKHAELRNNIFIDSALWQLPEPLSNNLFMGYNFYSVDGYTYTTWAAIGFGEGSIVNPNYNSSNPISLYNYFNELENFTLKSNSELIDSGYFPVPVKNDYNGNRRFQGARPDIGPQETSSPYSYEDCSNGIMDGNEEGIDCGGICEQDFDNDGYKTGYCTAVSNADCNDSNPLVNPGAEEICDGIDNNCDGQQHPDYYLDSDSDGFNNCIDNCPLISNPLQEDFDKDKIGDACDSETTYVETFDLRFTGMNDLNETRVSNGLSWEIISGIPEVVADSGGKIINVPKNGANQSDRCLLIAKEGAQWQNLTLSLRVKNYWGPTNPGFVFLYKDSGNYYFFDSYMGKLVKRINGVDSVIDSNSSLGIDFFNHDWHSYTIEASYDGSKVSFNVTKDNLISKQFVDNSPHSTKGTIGLLRDSKLRMDVDDIAVTIKNSEGEAGSLSPFTKLWSFLKSLLTGKTGQAILTGKITGNAVNESGEKNSKSLYVILSVLVVIILIIVIIIAKKKKKTGKRIGKKLKKAR